MRPIRSIATALLIAGVAVAGCAKASPTRATPPPASHPPSTNAPPVTSPTPSAGKTPVAAPRILSVTTSPVLPRDGGFLVLPAGAGTVTFHVRAVNTQRVRFLLGPTGNEVGDLAKPLGQDSNGRDGWTLTWHYKQNDATLDYLYVIAIGPGGTSPATTLGLTHQQAPRILSVTTSPALPSKSGWLQLAGSGTVSFRAQVVDAQRVRFLLGPTGTGVRDLAKLLGEDANGRDGWTVTWHYKDEGLLGYLYVIAIGPGGTSPETVLYLYHS